MQKMRTLHTALRVYFIACKTSPISRNNARYDNAIKASLMMALEPRGAVAAARSGDCGALMLWQFFMAGID